MMGVACPVRKAKDRKDLYNRTLERLKGVLSKYGKTKTKEKYFEATRKGFHSHLGIDDDDVHFTACTEDADMMSEVQSAFAEVLPILEAEWKGQPKFRTDNYLQIDFDYSIPASNLKPAHAAWQGFGDFSVQALAFTTSLEGMKYNVVIRPGPKRRSAILVLDHKEHKQFPTIPSKDLSGQLFAAADKIGRQFAQGK